MPEITLGHHPLSKSLNLALHIQSSNITNLTHYTRAHKTHTYTQVVLFPKQSAPRWMLRFLKFSSTYNKYLSPYHRRPRWRCTTFTVPPALGHPRSISVRPLRTIAVAATLAAAQVSVVWAIATAATAAIKLIRMCLCLCLCIRLPACLRGPLLWYPISQALAFSSGSFAKQEV